MAKDKKSFILYCDTQSTVNQLPDDVAGRLFKHILSYVNDENPISEELLVNIAFEPIKQQLKRDLKKYEQHVEQRRQAGKRSAEKRKQAKNNESERPLTTVESRSTKSTVSVTDSVTDSVNVIKSKLSIEKRKADFSKSLSQFSGKYPQELIKDFYDYWTEHGENDRKMRFEKEKSFAISRRLSTWAKNQKKWDNEKFSKNNSTGFESDSTETAIKGAIDLLNGGRESSS